MLLLKSSPYCHSREIGSNFFGNLRIASSAIAESFLHHGIMLQVDSFRISSSALYHLTLLRSIVDSVFNFVDGVELGDSSFEGRVS